MRIYKVSSEPMRGPRALENHKNIGFHSCTGPDALKITKLPSSIQCRAIICTPAERHINGVLIWRFAGGPLMAR